MRANFHTLNPFFGLWSRPGCPRIFASRPKRLAFARRPGSTDPDRSLGGGIMRAKILIFVFLGAVLPALVAIAQSSWPQYGGDEGGSRFSEAKQINRENVSQLRLAWTYRTGDISDGTDGTVKS